jgi:ankyrin repeat protein
LIRRGGDLQARLVGGYTPLHLAAAQGRSGVAAQLVTAGSAVDLIAAAGMGWQKQVERLLEEDAGRVQRSLSWGLTPLQMAARRGHEAVAEVLIEHGARLDLISARDLGWTARIPALLHGWPESVHTRGGMSGCFPLHHAAIKADADLVQLLIAHGADVNARDKASDCTPLTAARRSGHDEVAALLSRQGATV